MEFEEAHATCDHRPGLNHGRLHVWATALFPTPGWTWRITPRKPQGIYPQDLLLLMTVERPDHVVASVQTPELVEYIIDVPEIEYKSVTLAVDGDAEGGFSVNVIETS
jgi:hypothetical protein